MPNPDPFRRRTNCCKGTRTQSETFIIYDESSSHGADDPPSLLLIRRDKLPDRYGID
jgi:hypothetical protein